MRGSKGASMRLQAFCFCLLALAGAAGAAWMDDIGYTALANRTGAIKAGGAGVVIAQVEAYAGGYAPDQTDAEFAGKTFTLKGVAASPVSAHATLVGRIIYGNSTGIARSATDIRVFSDESFAGNQGLMRSTFGDPLTVGAGVINNSWIANPEDPADAIDVLRRLDFLINRDNVLAVAAVNNGADSAYPPLIGGGYNSIVAGISSGSSAGPINIDGGPRAKPDLVVPAVNTSEAAAIVSGSAALLLSEMAARGLPANASAVKAALLAGAKHLTGWHRGAASTADDTAVPLDYTQGAGQLRLDRSFDILVAGRKKANKRVPRRGWDLGAAGPTRRPWYEINFTSTVRNFAAVLVWNRRFEGTGQFASRTPVLANLNLYLQRKYGSVWKNVLRSESRTDNVETVTRASLSAGLYRLLVKSDITERYALAWDCDSSASTASIAAAPASYYPLSGAPAAYAPGAAVSVPEPVLAPLLVTAGLLLTGRPRRRYNKA